MTIKQNDNDYTLEDLRLSFGSKKVLYNDIKKIELGA